MSSFKIPNEYFEDDNYCNYESDEVMDSDNSSSSNYYSGECTELRCFDNIPNNYQPSSHYKYFDEYDINEDYREDYVKTFARYVNNDDIDEDNVSSNGDQEEVDYQEIYGYNDIPEYMTSAEESIINNVDEYKNWMREESVFNGGRDDTHKIDEILIENANTKNKTLKLAGSCILSLPELLSSFDWIEKLIITHTNIKIIDYLPPNLNSLIIENNTIEIFDASIVPLSVETIKYKGNKTKTIIGLQNGLKYIDLSYNLINEINSVIPSSVEDLNLDYNGILKELPIFENDGCNLKTLSLHNTRVSNIDNIPSTIQFLNTSGTELQDVNRLPLDLIEWKSYKCNKLRKINCDLPKGLIELDLCDCSLRNCPDIPINVKRLDLSKNILQTIPEIPPTIERVDLEFNEHLTEELINELKLKLPNSVNLLTNNNCNHIPSYEDILNDESNDIDTNDDVEQTLLQYNHLKWAKSRGFDIFNKNNNINDFMKNERVKEFILDHSNKFTKKNPHYVVTKKRYLF